MTISGSFEKSIKDLELIVKELEQGQLPLEKALKQFEKGVQLTRHCQQSLTQAEQKVAELMQNNSISQS